MMSSPATAQDSVAASPQAVYSIQGRDVHVPFAVRDATAAIAFYLVSASAAQTLIDASGLRVARVAPGRAVCTIGAIDYKDGEIGAYQEIAITFFVQERGSWSLPYVGSVIGLLRSKLSAYVHRLPVDNSLSCEVGQTIWGLPKVVAEIDISSEGDLQTSVLKIDGQHVLTQAMRTGGSRATGDRNQISYAARDGMLHRSPSVMNAAQVGFRLGGATLELGPHPIADELRSLGLPKRPLFTTYIGKMTGLFYAVEKTKSLG